MSAVASIMERYGRYGWTMPHGEWGHINNVRGDLRDALAARDGTLVEALLQHCLGSSLASGLVRYRGPQDIESMEAFLAAARHNIRLWHAYTDADDVGLLAAPAVGAPLLFTHNGHAMMLDTPRHDHYAHRLCALLPAGGTVFEIGGGYGGCALQLMRRSAAHRVVICDIPETLYIVLYWLSHALPPDRRVAWWGDDPSADIQLLPCHELDDYDGAPDAVFSAHCLSELDHASVDRYVRFVRDHLPPVFFHDSAHTPPPTDGKNATWKLWPETEVARMVPGPPYREVYRAQTIWYGTGDRYWEFLYQR